MHHKVAVLQVAHSRAVVHAVVHGVDHAVAHGVVHEVVREAGHEVDHEEDQEVLEDVVLDVDVVVLVEKMLDSHAVPALLEVLEVVPEEVHHVQEEDHLDHP